MIDVPTDSLGDVRSKICGFISSYRSQEPWAVLDYMIDECDNIEAEYSVGFWSSVWISDRKRFDNFPKLFEVMSGGWYGKSNSNGYDGGRWRTLKRRTGTMFFKGVEGINRAEPDPNDPLPIKTTFHVRKPYLSNKLAISITGESVGTLSFKCRNITVTPLDRIWLFSKRHNDFIEATSILEDGGLKLREKTSESNIHVAPSKPTIYINHAYTGISTTRERGDTKAPAVTLKPDWDEIKFTFSLNNIHRLYHFTDRSNLDSIKRHGGLYSWWQCHQRGIVIPIAGGSAMSRELDSRHSLQDYVRLSLTPEHPMMYVAKRDGRIPDPVLLHTQLDPAFWDNTLFSNMNAASNDVVFGNSLSDFQRINFKAVKSRYLDLPEELKPFHQAEVLVKSHLPIEYITNIDFI